MIVLGIETSCDETAVAIVDDKKNILSHVLKSQIDLHQKFGGVVPELAARSHAEIVDELILLALQKANLDFEEIDGFAATCGPGLIGGVIVGMVAAKTLSSIYKKPFIAINHLEAHALTVRLTNEIKFPYLLLLISGGHCQILLVEDIDKYKKIGETIDDALGESFDKVAQMLNLPYPGGPHIEKMAIKGNDKRFKFPRPLIDNKSNQHLFDFSFSGLKTAVKRQIEDLKKEYDQLENILDFDVFDVCASFQRVISEIIINRLENVFQKEIGVKDLVIAGGVAANRYIFSAIKNLEEKYQFKVITPPISLCTDNGVMVAWNGIEKLKRNQTNEITFKPKARWDLGM